MRYRAGLIGIWVLGAVAVVSAAEPVNRWPPQEVKNMSQRCRQQALENSYDDLLDELNLQPGQITPAMREQMRDSPRFAFCDCVVREVAQRLPFDRARSEQGTFAAMARQVEDEALCPVPQPTRTAAIRDMIEQGLTQMSSWKIGITEYWMVNAKFPVSTDDTGMPPPEVVRTEIGAADFRYLGAGEIQLVLRKPEELKSGTVTLSPSIEGDMVRWACKSTLPAKFLPLSCR